MEDLVLTQSSHNRTYTRRDEVMDMLDTQQIAKTNLDEYYSFNWLLLAFGVLATLLIFSMPLFATDANNDIMYVIDSPILRGRNDMVAKYSTGIAWLAQLLITACGFFIICLKTVTIGFTLLYLTHPDFWNKVSSVKENLKGRQDGSWITTIVAWCTPDVKALSEYADTNDDRMYNSGGMQSIGNYVKQNAVQFIALVTLASVLWSGKLLKLVGALSQGCVAVFDWALSIDYGGKVNDILEADRDYQFLYNTATTEGAAKQKFAMMLYSQVKTAIPDNRTSDFLNNVGKAIQTKVDGFSFDNGADGVEKHVNWSNPTLTMTMTWNSDKPDNTSGWKGGVYVIPMSEIVPVTGEQISQKQQLMNQKGVIYVTFKAQQTYNPADYNTIKDEKK